ncbi:MAG: ROK family protein [Acetatifactor sp.]|nr:ROK family protein [Acetatifactor sp.]
METYLGFDFGGTKLLIGEMDGNGTILKQKRYDTGILSQKEAAKRLVSCAEDYVKREGFAGSPVAAGVGIMGIVDVKGGVWRTLNHLEFSDIPLVQELKNVTGLDTVIDNDVKSATMAELKFGAGQISDNFIYVNIGTGLGAGIISGGKLIRGANNNAGEIGHIVVNRTNTVPCICGRRGCVEGLVSGMGIDSTARRMAKNMKTMLNTSDNGERIDAREVFGLAQSGDEMCREIMKELVAELRELLLNLVRTVDPDLIVFGGGVVSGDVLLDELKEEINCPTLSGLKYGMQKSTLDPTKIGLMGAATHAMLKRQGIDI